MSAERIEALLRCSRRLRELAETGDALALQATLAERQAHLEALTAEPAEALPEAAVGEVRRLEQETLVLFALQRDQVARELVEMTRGRAAVAGYRPPAERAEVSRFLDQSG